MAAIGQKRTLETATGEQSRLSAVRPLGHHTYHESGVHNRFLKYSRQETGSEGWLLAFSSNG